MKAIAQILCLLAATSYAFAAEDLRGTMYLVLPSTATLYGFVHDVNNPSNNTLQVKVCWDDSTFNSNCDKTLAANTASFPFSTCTAACNGFQYIPPTGTVGSVTPRDGKSHLMYVKVISQANPGAGDKPLEGSPWPFAYRNGTVAQMWDANLEASPTRLAASQLALLANSQDPYSVGSSGNTVCTVNGTPIKDDGVVGYYVQRHSVPCANVYVVSVPVVQTTTQATFYSAIVPTLQSMSSSLQAVAIGWVQPSAVGYTTGNYGQQSISAAVANAGLVLGSACVESGHPSLLGQGPINPYFNSASKAPFTDYGLRPAMMLAGETCPTCTAGNNYSNPWIADFKTAKSVIDAAIAAVDTNPSGGNVYWSWTSDLGRSQTAVLVSPLVLGNALSPNVNAQVLGNQTTPFSLNVSSKNILLYNEGGPHWNYLGATFLPGAGIGFAVTSTSGNLPSDGNQTNAASWLSQGAVGAYGNAIEPCELLAYKHPDPALVIPNYTQGQTLIEALWKSVRLPWGGNFVGDPLASPFSLGPVAPKSTPQVPMGGAVNDASFLPGSVSPGTVLAVFGSNLGPEASAGLQLDNSGRVTASAGGTRVLINGTPAPMIYAQSGQVIAAVPFGVPTNTNADLVVEYQGVPSAPVSVTIADVSPAIFTLDSSGRGQGAILNQDGSMNGSSAPAGKGSVVVLYATGAGVTSPPSVDGQLTSGVYPAPVQPVTVRIGGQQADVKYAGAAPGLISGVLQVNALVPPNVASGDQPVVIQVGSTSSQAGVTVAIQ